MKSRDFSIAFVFAAALLPFAGVANAGKIKDSGTFSLACLQTDNNLASGATISVTPANLWPPNHTMRFLTLSMSLNADAAFKVPVSFSVVNISDDQSVPDNAGNGGCGPRTKKQGSDWFPVDTNLNPAIVSGNLQSTSDSLTSNPGLFQVRGERCARAGTRTYAISVICCDHTTPQSPVCDALPKVLLVTVPKNQSK